MEHEQWEYRVETVKNAEVPILTSVLNGLGAQGWELVSMTTTVKMIAVSPGNDLVLVLKRRGVGQIEREQDRPGYIAY